MIVAMNYFLRWLEEKLLKVVNVNIVAIFLYKEIICRFKASRIL